FNQAAPGGFLALEKLAVTSLGDSEFSHRAVVILFSIASVLLFFAVARRVLKGWVLPAAVLLFASSGYLIHFGAQVKPYASDAFIPLVIVLVMTKALDSDLRVGLAVSIAVVGALAVWLSHPSVFVLAASGVTLAGVCVLQKDWKKLGVILACVVVWLASFA